MDIDELKFKKLGKDKRKLLLQALNVTMDNMHCDYCQEAVTYDKCGLLPPLKQGKTITIACNSPLCMASYLQDYEEAK